MAVTVYLGLCEFEKAWSVGVYFSFTMYLLNTGANVSVPLVVGANPAVDHERTPGGEFDRRDCGGAVRGGGPRWLRNHLWFCAHWVLPQHRQYVYLFM